MTNNLSAPTSLREAVTYFADPDRALAFLVEQRWPAGVICPHCGAAEPSFLKTRRIWKCRDCRKQFSVKVGTIFEDSPLGLDRWLPALWMLANCRNGISSYELARDLNVTQKTAWFMLARIRLAMETRTFKRMKGTVELDETFVGGAAENMHSKKRRRVIKGRGPMNKTPVFGMVERDASRGKHRVHAEVMRFVGAYPVSKAIKAKIEPGSTVYTDESKIYQRGLAKMYEHDVVNHRAKEYVRGAVHTNSLENFWSVFKRGVKGTYISVDPFHLFRYVHEAVFRYNIRGESEKGRFTAVVKDIVDRRLTYAQLIGKGMHPATT
jgi:transposase-like protein